MLHPVFNMVKYHSKQYPDHIPLNIEEVAGHLDVHSISPTLSKYSLHTEYSYTKRNFNSPLIEKYPTLVASDKKGVPQLWKDYLWAKDFASFVLTLTDGLPTPTVIEIHPPFSDYTPTIDHFLDTYNVFEEIILKHMPSVSIQIENRSGSVYSGGKFIFSKADDFVALSNGIIQRNLKLRFALDIPQLYTAHNLTENKAYLYTQLLDSLQPLRPLIDGVHLWGKKTNEKGRKIAHCGDLNSYFGNDEHKTHFLSHFVTLFNDNRVRNMVLEVNSSNEDILSIIKDLTSAGVHFC